MLDAHLNATRYLCPSFSNSAMTQSVTHGMPEELNVNDVRPQASGVVGGQILTLCIQTIHHPAYEFQFVL